MPPPPNVLPARTTTDATTGAAPPTPPTGVFLGPGLAYEAVSLASAMVVQDATSLMRQFSAVSTAALAVVTEKLVEYKGADPWPTVFNQVTANLVNASQVYVQLGNAAATVLGYFQPGATVPAPPEYKPVKPG